MLADEERVDVGPLSRRKVGQPYPLDAALLQLADQLLVEQPVLLADEPVDALRDPRQLLGRCQTIRREVLRLQAGVELLLQPGHPDLEELVQVGADDRQELDPLQRRVGRIGRLLEHPAR